MNVLLIGTGRMGQSVAQVCDDRAHRIVARFDSSAPFADATAEDVRSADVAVDFTLPDFAVRHIEHAATLGVPIVVGTTGWHDRMEDVQAIVDRHGASVLYAANFSLGVALLRRAVGAVAEVLDHLDDYDVAIHEAHHVGKVDSPSGTARLLGEDILRRLRRKRRLETETVHGAIDPEALHVTSSRIGRVFGRHAVSIDSAVDELTLEHRAKSRDGFALGAVRAAEWLPGRRGLFTLDDLIDAWLDHPTS